MVIIGDLEVCREGEWFFLGILLGVLGHRIGVVLLSISEKSHFWYRERRKWCIAVFYTSSLYHLQEDVNAACEVGFLYFLDVRKRRRLNPEINPIRDEVATQRREESDDFSEYMEKADRFPSILGEDPTGKL